jgi:hypothetical protein
MNFDPDTLIRDLDAEGYAVRPLLDAATCRELAALYDREALFRKRIIMEQRAYGQGEYQYFAYPLPETVAGLRAAWRTRGANGFARGGCSRRRWTPI